MKIEFIHIDGAGTAKQFDGKTPLGIPVPTPAQELAATLNAKPKPRPDQSPPPAGGLFDPRGPAPLQPDLLKD